MNILKYLALSAVVGFCFTVSAPRSQAQVAVEVGVGLEANLQNMVCPILDSGHANRDATFIQGQSK
jgi:hypothetical protein